MAIHNNCIAPVKTTWLTHIRSYRYMPTLGNLLLLNTQPMSKITVHPDNGNAKEIDAQSHILFDIGEKRFAVYIDGDKLAIRKTRASEETIFVIPEFSNKVFIL